jgi:hypothetical protein
LKEEECHLYFRNENKLTVINGKGLESDYDKLNIKVELRWVMGLNLRWSQEIEPGYDGRCQWSLS